MYADVVVGFSLGECASVTIVVVDYGAQVVKDKSVVDPFKRTELAVP
jgi:hypothetical protein